MVAQLYLQPHSLMGLPLLAVDLLAWATGDTRAGAKRKALEVAVGMLRGMVPMPKPFAKDKGVMHVQHGVMGAGGRACGSKRSQLLPAAVGGCEGGGLASAANISKRPRQH